MPRTSVPTAVSSPRLPQGEETRPVFYFNFKKRMLISFPLERVHCTVRRPVKAKDTRFHPKLLCQYGIGSLPGVGAELVSPMLSSRDNLPVRRGCIGIGSIMGALRSVVSHSSTSPGIGPARAVLLALLTLVLGRQNNLGTVPRRALDQLLLSRRTSAIRSFNEVTSGPPSPSPNMITRIAGSLSGNGQDSTISITISRQV